MQVAREIDGVDAAERSGGAQRLDAHAGISIAQGGKQHRARIDAMQPARSQTKFTPQRVAGREPWPLKKHLPSG